VPEPSCPCCGGPNVDAHLPLVAACDVLVMRALERVGNHILRVERSRFGRLNGRPRHEAHLLWQADPMVIEKGLDGAWDALPLVCEEHGCCNVQADEVAKVLDRYVRDLVATMVGHSVRDLRYRLTAYLNVPA